MSALDSTLSVLFLILSYLIGSIPFGLIFGKAILNIDIRQYGSKNIGSTNAIRVLGKKIGYLVFLCDVLKGMIIIILLKLLNNIWQTPIDYIYYGAMAIIGHCFPIYLGFKGGKGVATSLGVVIALTPLPLAILMVVFAIVFYTTGYVSLASTFATISVLITVWLLYAFGTTNSGFLNSFIAKPTLTLSIIYSLMSVLIIVKHFKNFKRLLNGTENSFKKKKTKD